MKARLTALLFVAAIVLVVFSSSSVQAQWPCGVGGSQYPGYGLYNSSLFGGSPYSLGQIPTPPYFALHPPVYYSAPFPRTYGYSPFAYPGTKETPEMAPVAAAKMIENPHVKPAKLTPSDDQTAVTWEVIRNPFADGQAQRLASSDSVGGTSE